MHIVLGRCFRSVNNSRMNLVKCVCILIGLKISNVDAYKRQGKETDETDDVSGPKEEGVAELPVNILAKEEVTITLPRDPVTMPLENETEYPPLKYWDMDVHCKFQPHGFQCNSRQSMTRWYFDIKMGDCKPYQYYKCRSNNANDFRSYGSCWAECRDAGPRPVSGDLTANAACLMQPDFGDCQDYIPMFYFDITQRRCLGFAFSGCGGNQNRFPSSQICQTVCVDATADLIENVKFNFKRHDNLYN